MHQSRNKKISLWGQGGVALADILANSVAVILILIVVTLSVQQEKADLELEKNADVTTLLARQIATTVVYNDLPSSPPAILHDYHSCAIPHDCDPSLYPIVELWRDYIREYNTGLTFYRKELLKANNPFDQLIQTFNDQEKLHIRIDVYDVSLYYLAIGILKEHGISPRHWHYLGEEAKPLISPEQALADGKHGVANAQQESLENSGEQINENNQGNSQQEGQTLDNTQLADLQTLQEIQHDNLLPPSEDDPNGEQADNPSLNHDGNSQQAEGSGQQGSNNPNSPETLFESLIELFQGEGLLSDGNSGQSPNSSAQNGQQGQQGQRGRRSLRMHVPNAKEMGIQRQSPNVQPIQLSEEDYNRVLLAFFLDQLQLARVQRTTFIQGLEDILNRYATTPKLINRHPDITLINQLDRELKGYFINKPKNFAPLSKQIGNHPNHLVLKANQVNTTSTLFINQADATWSENLYFNNAGISLILRSFPGLYKGQRLDFPPGHLLMVHPNEANHPSSQWRPILVVDPWLEDASLGFVKAAFRDNTLVLDTQAMGTQIQKTLIPEPKLQDNPQSKNIATLLYTSIGILLFFLVITGVIISLMLNRKTTMPKTAH